DVLASDYQAALSDLAYPENEQFRRGQRAWIARRNACRNWACLHGEYAKRIEEVSHFRCERVSALVCPFKPLPRSADGRVVGFSRGDCGSHRLRDVSVADCIEAVIYDPCVDADPDEADTSLGREACAIPHIRVAERRILKAEESAFESAKKWQNAGKDLQG